MARKRALLASRYREARGAARTRPRPVEERLLGPDGSTTISTSAVHSSWRCISSARLPRNSCPLSSTRPNQRLGSDHWRAIVNGSGARWRGTPAITHPEPEIGVTLIVGIELILLTGIVRR